jgi:hypothetical protein
MEGLTEGRIVHFVMPNGQHRPAIVVRVWRVTQAEGSALPPENGCSQLQVFTDGSNDVDQSMGDGIQTVMEGARLGIMWRTSILYNADFLVGTWHWIEKA